jgi:hypothetical protein
MKAAKLTLIIVGSIILGFVLLIGTCVGGVVMMTRGPVEAGDKLVQLCGSKKLHEAYELTTPTFRANTDEAAFKAQIEGLGLDRAISASWTSRNIENSDGRIAGTVRLADGKVVDLEVRSVNRDGRWQITSISPPSE